METNQKIVLSISLLASNRKDTIRRCLDSLKPIMEQIPSELIIVDTSKNEEIHRILLEYTDQVTEFEWCNDFAKARNVGLKLAKGEWFLFLDDDEWFVEIEELVRFFRSGEYHKYGCANYIVRNFYDPSYVNYSDSWVSRMVRIEKDTCFKSKIHEYLYPANGKCKAISSIANHSGYIYATKEDRRKHFERNAKLLLDMIEEEPEVLRWRVQLAQEYRSIKDWEALYKFCIECLDRTKNLDNKYDNFDIGTFYAGAMESLLFLKRYEESKEIGRRALEDHRNSELCHAYVHLCYGVVYFRQEDWNQAENSIRKYFKLCKQLSRDEVSLTDQKTALLVGEAMDGVPTKRAYSILICCGIKRNDTANLRKYFKYLEWDKKVIYAFDGILDALIEAMAKLPQEPVFVEAAQHVWNNRELQKGMFRKLQALEEKDADGFRRALHVVAQLSGEQWYLWYAKILVSDWDSSTDHLEEYLEGFFRNTSNVFLTPETIIRIAQKYGISLESLYLSVPFEQWAEHLQDYISKVSLKDIRITETMLTEMKTQDDVRYEYSYMRIAEAKALFSVQETKYEKKRESFLEFIRRTGTFCQLFYQKSIMDEYPELLPEYAQAALFMEQAFATEESDPKAALEYLKQVVDVYPAFADAVKSYMKAFGEAQEQKEQAVKEELRQLEIQIKEEVQRCLKQGQNKEALQILAQLKQMKPNDLEAAELTLRARLAML